MSLKARLALTLAIAFVAIIAIGGLLTYEQSRDSIAAELRAAETSAANRVAQLIAELPATRDIPGKLQGFIRSHNGDRDVRMMLIDSRGEIRASSQPAEVYRGLPQWFVTLLSPPQPTRIIPLSGLAAPVVAVVVSIDPRNEIAETWSDAINVVAILVAFILVTFAAIWLVVDHSLKPLHSIRMAHERIGAGETAVQIEPKGPPELRDLARGLNQMADRLGEASLANRRLSEQLQRLQDEERAALARDLHDDVGPLLFAIDVEAGAIARKLLKDEESGAAERANVIKQNAAQARKAVRRILTELRPGVMPGLGLKAALEEHLATLGQRHPNVTFKIEAEDATYPAPVETTMFRAIREAVNNALKHGLPTRISVKVAERDGNLTFNVRDDGGGFADGKQKSGFGIIGMRERLESAGGALKIDEVLLPAGVRVEGRIPLSRRAELATADGNAMERET
ncbi:two-component sensor histidine kinase [Fulvimarina pelagi HTCC2506]|uniref:histidine kinase n=1 Tax=Fulvimarina pelagi HTCC2506 TaxID=314231 RepID=Q0G657_9HYPH|nr:histidine kinase [Fulvimarina pelagi]EAU42857.1 two-component sensor histidine kinase [Fulvimarina pelagi HTCC2506]